MITTPEEAERQLRLGARGRHIVYAQPFRYVWRAVCSCGWMSAPGDIASTTIPRANLHIALATERDALAAEEMAKREGVSSTESLALALESIGTCSCGDRTWRGYCHTHAMLAARRERRASKSPIQEGLAA